MNCLIRICQKKNSTFTSTKIPFYDTAAAATAKSPQSCPTLSDPMDCSLPSSSVHGIFQERVLEWVAIAFSTNNASGGDGIPVELFQILKDDAVKVLHSVCQQIWKAQQ